jgi:hypothetical protein
MSTFFNFKLDLEPNIIDMIYDLLRMSTIQIITQVMFYMNNSSLSLFNETFIKTFVFINISIVFYYLVVRKVFSFVSDDYLNVVNKPYVSTPPIKSNIKVQPTIPTQTPPSPPSPPSPPLPDSVPKNENSTNTTSEINVPNGSTPINNIK